MIERNAATADPLGRIFGALSDPTRRGILARLREGEATIGALAEPLPMSLAAVSKHVQVLERAGLLQREVRGREHLISLDAAPLREAADWALEYQNFWEERLDAPDQVLRTRSENARKATRARGAQRSRRSTDCRERR